MPRPMPVSNRLAERDRLNVDMHWYWFQTLTMRSMFASGDFTWNPESRPSQDFRSDRSRLAEFSHECRAKRLVHDAGRGEFFCPRLVHISEDERERLLRARSQIEIDLVGADRIPAVRDAVRAGPGENGHRVVEPVVHADIRVARSVEPIGQPRAAEARVMVAPLAEFGLVKNERSLDFDLADRIRPLVVRHVVQRLEQAELDEGKQLHAFLGGRLVADRGLPDFGGFTRRDEEQDLDLDTVLFRGDPRVVETVAAFVFVERNPARLPHRVPNRLPVANVKVTSATVCNQGLSGSAKYIQQGVDAFAFRMNATNSGIS